MTYIQYLNLLYNRSWAAQRKQLRKDKQPCMVCGDFIVEVTPEKFWLCREHRVQLNNMQPLWTIHEKLERIGIEPPSEEDWANGKIKVKKVAPKKIRWILNYKTTEWEYNPGSTVKKK